MDVEVDKDPMLQPLAAIHRSATVACREGDPAHSWHLAWAWRPSPQGQSLGRRLELGSWLDVVQRAAGADGLGDRLFIPSIQRQPLEAEAHMVAEVDVLTMAFQTPCPHLQLGVAERELAAG